MAAAFESYVMWHGIADTLLHLATLTRAPAYRDPILEAEAKVRAASPRVDPVGIL